MKGQAMSRYVLGLDFGTDSVRAVVVDADSGAEKANQVAHDDLGQRIILFSPSGNELSAAVRDNFCHEQCTFRNGTLEDVFLRLTGRELRE